MTISLVSLVKRKCFAHLWYLYGSDQYHVLLSLEYWLKMDETETNNLCLYEDAYQVVLCADLTAVVKYVAQWSGRLNKLNYNQYCPEIALKLLSVLFTVVCLRTFIQFFRSARNVIQQFKNILPHSQKSKRWVVIVNAHECFTRNSRVKLLPDYDLWDFANSLKGQSVIIDEIHVIVMDFWEQWVLVFFFPKGCYNLNWDSKPTQFYMR